ncbi:putative ankyrin repeat protein RF_0381 [Artemia franciscana]
MNEFQETALDLAVTTKNLTLVKLLMPLGGIDEVELHQRLHYIAGMESNYISELLAIAVEVNRRKFIKVLVSNGANFGQCLHIAVENENKYTCEELIKNGADINARNEKNETPLDLALKTGKFDIVKVFGT